MKAALLLFLTAASLYCQIDRCASLDHHGNHVEALTCYQNALRSRDALSRAEAYLALRQYQQANDEFRTADSEHPNSAVIKTAWGNLFLSLDKQNEAANLFQEAIKADSKYAPAYVALSRTMSQSYDKTSVGLATEALKLDPKCYQGHELLAYLALEDGNNKLASEEAQKAISLSPEALDAMSVLASMDFLEANSVIPAGKSPWMDRILHINSRYGEAYDTVGHFLEINYRYLEAISAYRKALDLNPDLAQARSSLGVNLMRLGQTDEAQKQLARAYHDHFQNPETRNSLLFLDTLNQFQTFSTKSTEVFLNKNEAALLRPYIERELRLAMAAYERKYNLKTPGRIRLEVYPNHEDFVVRTLGLPGQGGLLGVTFDTVVAIDSPAAREPGDFSWADTLWHELCHVYVISATHQLVPRWFSEGLAVHEEGVASPQWGNRLNPDAIAAIKQKKLLPVLDLDAGFVRPQFPNQVLVSYFQSGKICDYIVQRWGDAAILQMIHSFADHKTTRDAIVDNLHVTPEAFDKDFLAWLSQSTDNVVSHFDQWKEATKAASSDLHSGNAAAALQKVSAVQDFYPEYPGTYDLLAKCYSSLGKKPEAMQALEKYLSVGGTGVDQLKQLAQLQSDAGRSESATRTLEEVNRIYPEDLETHRRLGALLLQANRPVDAVLEYRSALALKPADPAESHLNLARALAAAHQTSEAKDQVLLALETAPNYKPAQQLLLQLSQ